MVVEILEPLLIGLAVGIVVGALGAGGGILAVPILVYLLDQPPHVAAATSLVIVAVTSLASLGHHIRARTIVWRRSLLFAAATMAGSAAGSRVSLLVGADLLMLLFGALLAVVGAAMLRQALRQHASRSDADEADTALPPLPPLTRGRLARILALGLLSGSLTGFFGVGGGVIIVPMLVLVLDVPLRRAAGASLVAMVLAALAGLLARMGSGVVVDWPLALWFTAGSAVGGLVGGPLASRARPSTLTFVFAGLVLCVAAVTLVQTMPAWFG